MEEFSTKRLMLLGNGTLNLHSSNRWPHSESYSELSPILIRNSHIAGSSSIIYAAIFLMQTV
jgi:hypothetical protein